MDGEREQFGPALRSQRERRGITLESIAETTKIKRSLLAGLERNDVSQWPNGIFRRAYVRDYAGAIGLDPGLILSEFLRLFPEHTIGDPDRVVAADSTAPLRLTFAFDENHAQRRMAAQALAATIEAGSVLVAAGVLALAFGASFWAAAAILAVVYFSVMGVVTGRTLQYGEVAQNAQKLARAWWRPTRPLPLAAPPEAPPPVEEDFASHTASHTTVAS